MAQTACLFRDARRVFHLATFWLFHDQNKAHEFDLTLEWSPKSYAPSSPFSRVRWIGRPTGTLEIPSGSPAVSSRCFADGGRRLVEQPD